MTTQQGKTKRAELEARAHAIIADVREYDYDTRLTLTHALKDKSLSDKDLAGMVAEAEAGRLVEHPFHDSFEEDYRTRAHRALRFMDSGIPDFLVNAMIAAVGAAANAFNLEVWKEFPEEDEPSKDYNGEGYSARALADLFRVTEFFQLDLVPRPTLADSIAAVLNHPDTPTAIYNALGEAVTDLTHGDAVQNSAAVIALALGVYAEEKGGAR